MAHGSERQSCWKYLSPQPLEIQIISNHLVLATVLRTKDRGFQKSGLLRCCYALLFIFAGNSLRRLRDQPQQKYFTHFNHCYVAFLRQRTEQKIKGGSACCMPSYVPNAWIMLDLYSNFVGYILPPPLYRQETEDQYKLSVVTIE